MRARSAAPAAPRGLVSLDRVERRVPAFDLAASRRARSAARSRRGRARRPGSASCTVADLVGGQRSDSASARANTLSTALEHDRAGAERGLQLARRASRSFGRREGALEMPAHLVELRAAPRPGTRRSTASRRRPRTSCACTLARAGAGGEFRDQRADDLPLLRAGVLRLVDQHVVDAEIELVEHPGGGRVVGTAPASCRSGRRSRAGRGAPSRRDSARSPRAAMRDQRARCGRGSRRRARVSSSAQTRVLLASQPLGESRDDFWRIALGDDVLARRRDSAGAETSQIRVDARRGRPACCACAKPLGLRPCRSSIAGRRAPPAAPASRPAAIRDASKNSSLDRLERVVRVDAERRRQFARSRHRRRRRARSMRRSRRACRIASRDHVRGRSGRRPTTIAVASARAERAVRLRRRASSSTSSVSWSSNLRLRRVVQHRRSARATSASNGNWCSSRVQKAWMVCTFSPPGVSSASGEQPPRARAQRCVGRCTPMLADRLVERGVVERGPVRRACRTRGSPCWRRRPW